MNETKMCPLNQFYDQLCRPAFDLLFFAKEVYKVYKKQFFEIDYQLALEKLTEEFEHKKVQWGAITPFKIHLLIRLSFNGVSSLNPMVVGHFFLSEEESKDSITVNTTLNYIKHVVESIEGEALNEVLDKSGVCTGTKEKPMLLCKQELCDEFEEVINAVVPKLSKLKEYPDAYYCYGYDHIPELSTVDKEGRKGIKYTFTDQEKATVTSKFTHFIGQYFKEWGTLSDQQIDTLHKIALEEVSIYNPVVWLILFPEDFTLNHLLKIGIYYHNFIRLKK